MLTPADAKWLRKTWVSKFPNRETFEASIERYLEKIPQAKRSSDGAERWLREDAEGFDVRTAFLQHDMLDEAHPQEDLALGTDALEQYIARGDLHDWSELEPIRHAAQCPRCQMGIHSREIADRRAAELGKKPFPSFGEKLQQLYGDTRIRCVDCGVWEDEPSPDTCPRSFWHLPDIWRTLHPGQTLDDLGTMGPFMRGFLRRQRPA